MIEIKSPLTGIFYIALAPDAKPFTEKGNCFKEGDVLCIIEAMKMLNEITARHNGRIVEICAQNDSLVQAEQVLFVICEDTD